MTPYKFQMENENKLREKLNNLQAEMLDFNKRISPVKETPQTKEESTRRIIFEQLQTIWLNAAFTILKAIVTFIGPIIFPTIVYYAEGCSPLFWEAMAVSCFILFVIVTITFSILWNNAKKIKTYVSHIIKYLENMLKYDIILKYINENACFKFFYKSMFIQIFCTLIFLCIAITASCLVYRRYTLILFYVFLTSIGFILRSLIAQLSNYSNSKKKLPLHNPCAANPNSVKATRSAKRELDFSSMGKGEGLPYFISPLKSTSSSEKNRVNNTWNCHYSDTEYLIASPLNYHEATECAQNNKFSSLKKCLYTP